ncbi:TPA: radical SAM protein [Salmonella enterica]|nr:radical SAM protein [Salmonella enterica]HDY3020390.1 radical SAM protein [Salmonella enterica]
MNRIINTEMYYFDGDDGFIYVHFPIRGYALKTREDNKSILDKLKHQIPLTDNEEKNILIENLCKKNLIGSEFTQGPKIKDIESFKPIEATLLLTENCNLACSYCYARASGHSYKPMSKETAKAAVDLVINNAKEHKHKCAEFRFLGGGEPTTEWEILVWITNYIRLKADMEGVKYWIRLITNGVLLTENKTKWIAKNIQYVTLSFDILPELQLNRPFANGKDSHKSVIRAANLLVKYNVPCHFRTTISYISSSLLKDMVEYTKNNTGIKAIRFEPMAEIGRASDTEMEKPEQQKFVDSFVEAYQLGKKYGILVTCKMMTNIWRRSSRFCNIEFAVTSEGNVAGCHRYSRQNNMGFDFYHVGKIKNNQFEFDLGKINSLRKIDAHQFLDCQRCFARWSCASGCLSARLNNGEVSQHGPLCHITRELLKFSIKEALNV